MRVSWLADVLHDAGLPIVPMDGWRGRGKELISVQGVVLHHTATGMNWPDRRVAMLLRDGRSDLPGPLSQLGLDRQGRFWLISDGRCNHNGHGEWGNNSIGIEAFNDGKGEKWPAVMVENWQRGTAAILRHLGLGAGRARGHRETDPGRKTDPKGIDLPAFRREVDALLQGADLTPEQDSRLKHIEAELEALNKLILSINHEVAARNDGRLYRALKMLEGISKKVGA